MGLHWYVYMLIQLCILIHILEKKIQILVGQCISIYHDASVYASFIYLSNFSSHLTLIMNKYSLLMHCIKMKSSAKFLWNEQNIFVGRFISFQSALTVAVLQWQKSLPDISGITIQDVGSLAPMEPGIHTMNNELILQISGNIFLALKWISMMRSGYNISHIY